MVIALQSLSGQQISKSQTNDGNSISEDLKKSNRNHFLLSSIIYVLWAKAMLLSQLIA